MIYLTWLLQCTSLSNFTAFASFFSMSQLKCVSIFLSNLGSLNKKKLCWYTVNSFHQVMGGDLKKCDRYRKNNMMDVLLFLYLIG